MPLVLLSDDMKGLMQRHLIIDCGIISPFLNCKSTITIFLALCPVLVKRVAGATSVLSAAILKALLAVRSIKSPRPFV